MRIDDPVLMRAAGEGARRETDLADRAVGDGPGADAWLLEIERARREAWRCEATAQREPGPEIGRATPASTGSPTGSTADAMAIRQAGAGERPLRPYGVEPLAALAALAGEAGAAAANDGATMRGMATPIAAATKTAGSRSGADATTTTATTDARPADIDVAADMRAAMARGEARSIAATDAASGRGAGADGDSSNGSTSPSSTSTTAQPGGAGEARGAATATATAAAHSVAAGMAGGGEQAPVRLHVERGVDGRLNAWLGVDRGAQAQAAAVVAHWRDDAHRRGESVGDIHINGRTLARDGDASDPPAHAPAFIDSNAGEQ